MKEHLKLDDSVEKIDSDLNLHQRLIGRIDVALYFAVFVLSAYLAHLAGKALRNGWHVLGVVLTISAALPPVVLSGLRSEHVGTDTSGYVSHLHSAAVSSNNFVELWLHSQGTLGLGYTLLSWVSVNLSQDIRVFLFGTAAVQIFIVLIALVRLPELQYLGLAYFVYQVLYFNESLNMVRQSLAHSVLIMALSFMLTSNIVKHYVSIGIAMMFHPTAIIGLIFFPLYRMYNGPGRWMDVERQNLNQRLKTIVIIMAGTLALALFKPIARVLVEGGLFHSNYLEYLTGEHAGISLTILGLYSINAVVWMTLGFKTRLGPFIAVCSAGGCSVYMLCAIYSQYLFRISSMLLLPIILGVALAYKRSEHGSDKSVFRNWQVLAVALVPLIMWIIKIAVMNQHETIPYTANVW